MWCCTRILQVRQMLGFAAASAQENDDIKEICRLVVHRK